MKDILVGAKGADLHEACPSTAAEALELPQALFEAASHHQVRPQDSGYNSWFVELATWGKDLMPSRDTSSFVMPVKLVMYSESTRLMIGLTVSLSWSTT